MAVFRSLGMVALALAVTACGTDAVPPSVTTGVAVLTYHDTATDFSTLPTYGILTKLAVVTYENNQPVYTFVSAPEVLGAIEANMADRGFQLVARIDPENPPITPTPMDLAIVALGYQGTQYTYYPCDFWPWWGYPTYGCDVGWSWIAYRTGTLVIEMANTSALPPSTGNVPLAWAGVGYTVLTPENYTNARKAVEAVNQAFAQSPYLTVH